MHTNICILVSGETKDDAISNAIAYMDENAINKFCDYYQEKPIAVIPHGEAFNKTLYRYTRERLFDYRIAKLDSKKNKWGLEFKYHSIIDRMKILLGLPLSGTSFADADECRCKLSAYKRKQIKENPEQYYLVIFDYHC